MSIRRAELLLFAALAAAPLVGQQPAGGAGRAVAPATTARQFRVDSAIVEIDADGVARVTRGVGPARALPTFDPRLHLRSGVFDPMAASARFGPRLAAPADARLFAVQARTALLPEYRADLTALGAEVVGYWPASAWLVRVDAAVADSLRQRPWVRWVGAVAVGDKLSAALHPLVQAPELLPPAPVRCCVLLAQAAERARAAAAIVDLGGQVEAPAARSMLLAARLTPAQLRAVARLDEVLWIDTGGDLVFDVDNARIQGGANHVETLAGLSGQGVRVEILESLQQTHPDWTLPPLARFDGTQAHGHCTAMIVAGNGSGNPLARGLLPNAQVIETGVDVWFGAVPRYDIVRDSVDAALPWRAMQATASWGNGLVRSYDALTAELDAALFDFDLPTTQSHGNSSTSGAQVQAWAKNVISVGGLQHFDNSNPADDTWTTASIGPAADGRIKPDLCAYYDSVLCGDLQGSAGFAVGDYFSFFSGTSAATPIVNGYLGLLQQMFTDGLFHNPLPFPATAAFRFENRPHLSTAKSLLINTAASYAFAGAAANLTRTHQGWGFPDVGRAYDQRAAMIVRDEYDTLQQGDARTIWVWVRPGTAEFRATMTYTDPAAVPSAAIHRVNSLDLHVERFASGQSWWGNNGLDVGNASAPGGVANDRDTTENVWLPAPTPGIYAVTVSAPTLVQDGHVETAAIDADYALVVHPAGGGFHTQPPMTLGLVANTPGQLQVQVAGVPAAGWSQGFTFFSLTTGGPEGFGDLFGIERDFLVDAILAEPALPGSVLHFPNAGQQSYPFAPFSFPPALILALSGVTIDALVTLFDPQLQIVEQSNVARVTLP